MISISNTTTTYSVQNLASSSSIMGTNALRFTISENATSAPQDGALKITMSEFNTLDRSSVVPAAKNWSLPSILDWWPCSGFDPAPMYFAIFKGYLSISNVTQATPLPLFPQGFMTSCPNRSVSSFDFRPNSSLVNSVPLVSSNVVRGYYSSSTTETYTNGTQPAVIPFSQGIYTIAAGDEWGSLRLIYFVVS